MQKVKNKCLLLEKYYFSSFDENVRQVFSRRYDNESNLHRKLLTCTETVTRFLQILEKNKFENGMRIDYFDKDE